ncbi:VOC family protein [Burkholderia ubonensis]|uniref:VOC family protein n=1 Tax=Burkholderia ubonensis TaxID=101571 RepID=UPI0012F7315C|nr:VOC family protein [Burkholderia ubonensis]
MRADIFVPTVSVDEQVRFYVKELRIFVVSQNCGMGEILLRHIDCPSFCLQLQPNRSPSGDWPIFCMTTEDCRSEFARLSVVAFQKGGLVTDAGAGAQPCEYPLGQTISLRDASGNLFLVTEWYPSAL